MSRYKDTLSTMTELVAQGQQTYNRHRCRISALEDYSADDCFLADQLAEDRSTIRDPAGKTMSMEGRVRYAVQVQRKRYTFATCSSGKASRPAKSRAAARSSPTHCASRSWHSLTERSAAG